MYGKDKSSNYTVLDGGRNDARHMHSITGKQLNGHTGGYWNVSRCVQVRLPNWDDHLLGLVQAQTHSRRTDDKAGGRAAAGQRIAAALGRRRRP